MARSSSLRLAALIIANVLIPLAVVIFASGFFPYKPFLPGLATSQDEQEGIQLASEAVFDRVVFMVVDALRSDFVYGYNSGFEFTQRYSIWSLWLSEWLADYGIVSYVPAPLYPSQPMPRRRQSPCRVSRH